VLVAIDGSASVPDDHLVARRASLPFVVVGLIRGPAGSAGSAWSDLCDVVVEDGDPALEQIEANLARHPVATTTLALLLRGSLRRSGDDGLVAESAAYSVLQAGPEFAAWRASRPVAAHAGDDGDDIGPRVRVERTGDTLTVTLTRPQRLNALDARMRDELTEALTVAAADPSIATVELRGEGRAFCAGGDLDEFGSRADPASAHLVRLERHLGRTLSGLGQQTVAHLHGACMGSGIELAAFTDRVVAASDTTIGLPEIGLGLIPGAGGTVSLPRRIGRLRTAWLALSGGRIDVTTALSWGLVDAIEPA
jgi:enoyl-CoA hydratase/carnithine racemase